jgi:cytoskeletal protein CcmA (bactofilin family)
MWRKNQEPQTPAAVPPAKTEAIKTDTVKSETTKPETIQAASVVPAPEIPVAPVVVPQAPAPAPFTAAANRAPSVLPSNVDSRIGSGLKIRGEISGTSDMYIDGDVQGKVRIGSGILTIGANGRVQADLEAREIVVNGSVVGNLKATDRVQLGSSGSVQGGVVTPRIGIDDGARLRGNVETARAGETRTAAVPAEKEERRAMAATQSKGE